MLFLYSLKFTLKKKFSLLQLNILYSFLKNNQIEINNTFKLYSLQSLAIVSLEQRVQWHQDYLSRLLHEWVKLEFGLQKRCLFTLTLSLPLSWTSVASWLSLNKAKFIAACILKQSVHLSTKNTVYTSPPQTLENHRIAFAEK